jgi:hypothetical protein
MNGSIIAIAFIGTVIGVLTFIAGHHFWPGGTGNDEKDAVHKGRRHLCERIGAGIFTVAAFGYMIGLAPVLAALWELTGTGLGLVILIAMFIVTAFFGFVMIIRGRAHHTYGTAAVAVLFGMTIALFVGGWHQMGHSASLAVAGAGHGISGAFDGHVTTTAAAGHHAAATAHAGGGLAVIIVVAVVVALAVVFLRSRKAGKKADEPARAIPGGGRRAGLPAAS